MSERSTSTRACCKEIIRLQTMLREILAKHTGQDYEKIAHDSDRDFWLTAEAAVEYGLVDEILQPSQAKELTLVGGAASHE